MPWRQEPLLGCTCLAKIFRTLTSWICVCDGVWINHVYHRHSASVDISPVLVDFCGMFANILQVYNKATTQLLIKITHIRDYHEDENLRRTNNTTRRQTPNMKRTLVGNEIVYHSDVVGASLVDAAPTPPSFSTSHMASMDWAKTNARRDEKHSSFGIFVRFILEIWRYINIGWDYSWLSQVSVRMSGI